jgi:hypothetical protein
MKQCGVLFLLSLVVCMPVLAHDHGTGALAGYYAEFRTADVFTGPCFANSEVHLTGHEAALAWHIERGTWKGVPLGGLSVVAIVRANATLGDPFSNPFPAKAVFLLDMRASQAQQQALVEFAQAQTGALLKDVVAVEVVPIRFTTDVGGQHGAVALDAGETVRLRTRALNSNDHFCTNEEVYYPPLAANLHHAMPAVVVQGAYRGNHLGTNWEEAGRRGAFVGTFAF